MGRLRTLDEDEIEEVKEILEDRHPLYYNGTTISDIFPSLKNFTNEPDSEEEILLPGDIQRSDMGPAEIKRAASIARKK